MLRWLRIAWLRYWAGWNLSMFEQTRDAWRECEGEVCGDGEEKIFNDMVEHAARFNELMNELECIDDTTPDMRISIAGWTDGENPRQRRPLDLT